MDLVVVLHNIRSVYNVGSIFRTCDGARSTGSGQAGVSKIYLTGITPGPLDRFDKYRKDFSKVALGAERLVEWQKVKTAGSLINKLKKEGFLVAAVEQDKKSIPYYKFKLRARDKIALVFGGEVRGLPRSILNKVDKILEIPMKGGKESLNVSVAAGIVIYRMVYPGV